MSEDKRSHWRRVYMPVAVGFVCLVISLWAVRTETYWLSIMGLVGALWSCVVVLLRVKSGPIVGNKNW